MIISIVHRPSCTPHLGCVFVSIGPDQVLGNQAVAQSSLAVSGSLGLAMTVHCAPLGSGSQVGDSNRLTVGSALIPIARTPFVPNTDGVAGHPPRPELRRVEK